MKVLFLQSKAYFDELGVDATNLNAKYCIVFSLNIKKEIKKYDLVVSCIDHELDSRKIVDIANKQNIPTVFLMDGVYDFTNAIDNPRLKKMGVTQFLPFLYGNIFLLGEDFKRYILEKYPYVNAYTYLPERAALNFVNAHKNYDLLITTSITPYFNLSEKRLLIDWFRAIIETLNENGVSFKLRIFDEELMFELREYSHLNNRVESLSSAISDVSCVLCTPSTVIHSLTEYGIPNIVINYRGDSLLYNTKFSLSNLKMLDDMIVFINSAKSSKSFSPKQKLSGLKLEEYEYVSELRVDEYDSICNFYFSPSTLLRKLYKKMPKRLTKHLKKYL